MATLVSSSNFRESYPSGGYSTGTSARGFCRKGVSPKEVCPKVVCPKHRRAIELIAGVGASVLATALITRRRSRKHEQDIALSNARAQVALEELQAEEIRVRRLVSDQLHGALQNRMVMITAGIDAVAGSLAENGDLLRANQLKRLAEELDELREREVRNLSHTLFPAGIELGTVRALQFMINRLPPQIDAVLELGPTLQSRVAQGGPLMPLAERLIIVSTVEEAITNALKHGGATKLVLHFELEPNGDGIGQVLKGVVSDNGRGFSDDVLARSGVGASTGLRRATERMRKRSGYLNLTRSDDGWSRLEFALPLPPEPAVAPEQPSQSDRDRV